MLKPLCSRDNKGNKGKQNLSPRGCARDRIPCRHPAVSFYPGPSKLGVASLGEATPLSNANQKRVSAADSLTKPPLAKCYVKKPFMFLSKTPVTCKHQFSALGCPASSRGEHTQVSVPGMSGGFQGAGHELSIGDSEAQSKFFQNSEYSE